MPEYTFDAIEEQLLKQRKKISDSNLAVLGVSFKNNTGDCRFTPIKYIIEKLVSSGCQLKVCDPWVSEEVSATIIDFPLTVLCIDSFFIYYFIRYMFLYN